LAKERKDIWFRIFWKNLNDFQKLINEKYLYTILNDKNRYEIKCNFENFVFSYFMQIGIDINFNDIADIEINESINIFPFRFLQIKEKIFGIILF